MRTVGRILFGALLIFGLSSASAQMTVYEHDFDTPVGPEWSSNLRTTTPNLARIFLGRFAGENVRLNLDALPEHCSVTVSFDLLIIGSWEGSTGYFSGPDTWDLDASVPGECCPSENLLHASFANCACRYQSYPDTYPDVYHPGLTGAEEVESLGYHRDSVYHMSFTFYHWRDSLQLSFAGNQQLQNWTDESWGLDNLVVQVDTQSCCRAHRQLPSVLVPGSELPVEIDVHPNPGTQAYAVEEDPVGTWEVLSINDGGVYDEVSGLIKWGPFFGDSPRVLSYSLATPGGNLGTARFSGTISVDGINEGICGDTEVTGGSFHPADLNQDWAISDDELTGYAATWRRGDPWNGDPMMIPADFVTNAGMLWRSGGDYVFDKNANPPWSPAAGAKSGGGSLEAISSSLVAAIGVPVEMTLQAHPQEGTLAYLVKDQVPEGVSILDAGDGVFDATTRVLRFGPFFDDQERSLSYSFALSENSLQGVKRFQGSASYDGREVLASGTRVVQQVGVLNRNESEQ